MSRSVLRTLRTPLTLLVLLAILGYGAWWGWTNIWKPIPPPEPDPCVPTKVSKGQLKSSQVTINVYNGGGKTGQAGDIARQLRAKQFTIGAVANYDSKVTRTVVIGNAAKNPEVRLVRSFFKGSVVKVDDRPNRTVDVVVGSQYGGFNDKAKTAIAVSTETVCLPAKPTPAGGS